MIKDYSAIKTIAAFFVPEATPGTLAYPSASHVVGVTAMPSLKQTPATMANPEIFSSLSVIEMCKTQNPPGEWTMACILHCSGAAGTAPPERYLMEGLFGLETITAGTDVTYSPKMEKKSYSIWFRVGHTVFFATGSTVEKGDLTSSPATNCYITCARSGKFMRKGWVGSAPLTAALSTTTVTVGTSAIKRFCAGGMVYFENAAGTVKDDKAGVGYKIVSVNYTLGTFVVDSAPAAKAIGDSVKAFLPSATINTAGLPGRFVGLTIGGVSTNFVSTAISFSSPQFYPSDEATTSMYPENYTDGDSRDVSVSIVGYFKPGTVEHLRTIDLNETVTLSLKSNIGAGGAAAGERIEFYAPRFRINSLDLQEAKPSVKVTIAGALNGTSGEDELEMIYS